MKPQALPNRIQLTPAEQEVLALITTCQGSSLQFWLETYRARGIDLQTLAKVPLAVPASAQEFRLEWHPRALGPRAISLGAQYRKIHEEKDREFAAKLRRKGHEVWS